MNFVPDAEKVPRIADHARMVMAQSHFVEHAKRSADPTLTTFVERFLADPDQRPLIEAVFGGSPFLADCMVKEMGFLRMLFEDGPDIAVGRILSDIKNPAAGGYDTPTLMQALRIAKRRSALTIGLADLAGLWRLDQVTGALSHFADVSLQLASAHVLRTAAAQGEIALRHPDDPERDSGLIVLAMGKLGATELNYSSDIDIIIFYDGEKVTYTGRRSVQECFIRMTREIVRLLDERTQDGYVFRTDLRLRPDPGSTPPAISVAAAEVYYEGFGQNWERAAMIKARAVAGDIPAGELFLKSLRPFIWRKHLDFAAIQDIHSIKRQIDAHRGNHGLAMPGHNIKLGRGGIREVEFFAQTQQLIWGGRQPELRDRRTCATLDGLARLSHIPEQTAAELTESYVFLRQLEHRLQMIEDRQTQSLPTEPAALTKLARFSGYEDASCLEVDLLAHLNRVASHYARLFANAPALSGEGVGGSTGNLVFTGTDDDPETLQTLVSMGFENASMVSAQIRGWHHGRIPATRSTRARELLTELTPALLKALGRTSQPDQAFLRFDQFFSKLPAGVPLFSLFNSNLHLLDLVAEIMGDSPRLAEQLSRHAYLFDNLLSPAFLESPPLKAELEEDLNGLLGVARDYQETLDVCRRWANDRRFQIGVLVLRGTLEPDRLGQALTDIADTVVAALLPWAEQDLARAHGRIPGGRHAILALGKWGSREMTATSDLDLILIYQAPDAVTESNGVRPIAPSVWYARLTQRLTSALTAKTSEGSLYEVDMRLRPSGNAGPVATSVTAFERYHQESAWTWEHMALTRARVVIGDADLGHEINAVIHATLTAPRDPEKLVIDVSDMRERMARELRDDGPWDVKLQRGSLVDIDFIAQYLQLRHAHAHPAILGTNVPEAIRMLGVLGLVASETADALIEARRFWTALQHVLRLTVAESFSDETASPGLKRALADAAGLANYAGLQPRMAEMKEKVQIVFAALIEAPARQARQNSKDQAT